MGPLAAPPMSTRWFAACAPRERSSSSSSSSPSELAYAYAALSALRETTARVAASASRKRAALAQRFDGLLALGRERLGAVAEQPALPLLASNGPDALARGAAIPQRETPALPVLPLRDFTGRWRCRPALSVALDRTVRRGAGCGPASPSSTRRCGAR